MFYVDVTTADVARTGYRVVRVVVPGLIPNWPAGFPFLGKRRVQDIPVQLGGGRDPWTSPTSTPSRCPMRSVRTEPRRDLMTAHLDNGLPVVIESLPFAHSVAVGCVVEAGSRFEEDQQSGLSHFIEHLVFRGSEGWPSPLEVAVAAEGLGGELDAYTDTDHAVYRLRVHPDGFPGAVRLLADLMLRPMFRESDLVPERDVVVGEISDSAEDPGEAVQRLLELAAWGAHPVSRDIAGRRETVMSLTAGDLRDYWGSHYTAANCVLTVAGAVDPDEALRLVEAEFGAMPAGLRCTSPPTPVVESGPTTVVVGDEGRRTTIGIGLPGVGHDAADRWAMHCMNAIIGGSMSSWLFQDVRGRQGLTYQIGSRNLPQTGAGLWMVAASLADEDLEPVLTAIGRTLGRARSGECSHDEIRRAAAARQQECPAVVGGHLGGGGAQRRPPGTPRVARVGGRRGPRAVGGHASRRQLAGDAHHRRDPLPPRRGRRQCPRGGARGLRAPVGGGPPCRVRRGLRHPSPFMTGRR